MIRNEPNIHEARADEVASTAKGAPPETPALTRRKILRGLAALLVGIPALPHIVEAQTGRAVQIGRVGKRSGAGRKQWPKPPAGLRKPRHRHTKKKTPALVTMLAPGFYLNPKSQVVHYVTPDRKIARVHKISEKLLQPLKPTDLVKLPANTTRPRVHLAVASYSLEQAALASVQAKDYSTACQLLAAAIRHDQLLKKKRAESHSLRLYDLLGAVALRFGQQQYFSQMVALAQSARQLPGRPLSISKVGRAAATAQRKPTHPARAFRKWKLGRARAIKLAGAPKRNAVLDARLKKWLAANSVWSQRWRDLARPFLWKRGGGGPVRRR